MDKKIATTKTIEMEATPGSCIDDVLDHCVKLANDNNCIVKVELNGSNFIVRKTDTVKEMLEWYWNPRTTWDSGNME